MDTPAGWYDDGSGRQRWWDGQKWTDQYAPNTPGNPATPGFDPHGPGRQGSGHHGSEQQRSGQHESGRFAPVPEGGAAHAAAPYGAPAYGSAGHGHGSPTVTAPGSAQQGGKRKPNILGIIALALAVIATVLACIPSIMLIGWILLPIAFILSVVALFLKARKWPAIAGVILSVIGTIVAIVVVIVLLANAANTLRQSMSTLPKSGPAPVPTLEASSDPSAPSTDAPGKGAYDVTIDSVSQTTDFSGKPAVIVTFTFTNNSNMSQVFLTAVRPQASQNGTPLALAILTQGLDTASPTTPVKPGGTAKVQIAYKLADSSEVTVAVNELLSNPPKAITTKSFPLN